MPRGGHVLTGSIMRLGWIWAVCFAATAAVACADARPSGTAEKSDAVASHGSGLYSDIDPNLPPGQIPDDDDDVPPVPANPRGAVHYPGVHQSLQAAVDATSNGGVLFVGAGAHLASATVTNKRLFIVGAGAAATTLVSDLATPGQNAIPAVLTIGSGANVVLRNLSLSSSGDALRGVDDASATLRMKNVAITNAGGGIVGSFDKLVVHSLTVSEAVHRAAYVLNAGRAVFKNVTVNASDPDARSIVIDNTRRKPGACIVRIVDSEFTGGGRGGISVIGGACPVFITRTRVVNASVYGIGLFDVSYARLQGVEVLGTKGTKDVPSKWGDGLFVWGSDVKVDGSRFQNNARAGFSVFGCAETSQPSTFEITGSTLACNAFDLVLQSVDLVTGAACGAGSLSINEEANDCTSCSGTSYACKAADSGGDLTPIPPP